MSEWDLPLIWAGVIGTAVALYVVLDGFDLGIGILFPFSRGETERASQGANISHRRTLDRIGQRTIRAGSGRGN